MKEITYEESLVLKDKIYVDVRSPLEFSEDHIPGAINMPIFSNHERSDIGIIYKTMSKNDALVKGSEIVGEKISEILSGILKLKSENIIIYCARGGMRSGAVTSLIISMGIDILKLNRGYKGYRNFIYKNIDIIRIKPPVFILQGLTGSGKTKILERLSNSIDLEAYAGHRGSVFGGFGKKQNGQKKFESLLFERITNLENEKYLLFEAESIKIGNLHIPENIFSQMRKSPKILLKTPIERRVDIILEEYNMDLDREKVLKTILSLKRKLGEKLTFTLSELFKKNDLREFTRILLEKYYDPLYLHSINKFDYISEIENIDIDESILLVQESIEGFLSDSKR
jgi:tRNA 2-selenouridine synthase